MCALYSIQYNLEPAHQKSVFLKNFYESSLNQIDERIRYCKLHGLRKESEYKSCSVQLFVVNFDYYKLYVYKLTYDVYFLFIFTVNISNQW